MSESKEYKCRRCDLIVTIGGYSSPKPKHGGPCPSDSSGNHSWSRQ